MLFKNVSVLNMLFKYGSVLNMLFKNGSVLNTIFWYYVGLLLSDTRIKT